MARTAPASTTTPDIVVASGQSPAYQAYQILHWGFVAAPVIAGLDKFANLLTSWEKYIAPEFARMMPFSPRAFMMIVGVVEIVAALIVALRPRLGGYVVAAWLGCIIVNLLVGGAFYDVALRDFGLLLGALALARLSIDFETHHELRTPGDVVTGG
jgi:hypothetical protein